MAVMRDYILIGLAAAVSAFMVDHWVYYLATVWFIGVIQLGLGETLTHEAAHLNLFKTKKLNHWGQLFYCYPFFFTLSDYRREHREHHLLLNTAREQLHEDYKDHGLLDENPKMVWIWFFKPVLGYAAYTYLRSVVKLATPKSALKLAAFWSVVAAAAAWGGWFDLLILYWVVPLLWSFSSFFYWSEIEDHYNTRCGTRTNVGWLNLFTHNNGYHYIHHRYPSIPWYNLKRAHEELSEAGVDTSRGFFDTFQQISRRDT